MASSVSEIAPEYGLHPYQRQLMADLLAKLAPTSRASGPKVIAHMPTGAGKTRVACAVACQLLNHPSADGKAIVWLASTEELCEQAAADLTRAWETLGNRPVAMQRFWGDYSADLNGLKEGFLVAGLSKLWAASNKRVGFIRDIAEVTAGVIFDEAHQAIAPTYKFITEGLVTYRAPLLGLTATPGRTADMEDTADYELAELFDRNKVTIDPKGHGSPVSYLIRQGFLAEPSFSKIMVKGANLAIKEPEAGMDYSSADLRLIGDNATWQAAILDIAQKALQNHNRVIVFCPSVQSAMTSAESIKMNGQWSAAVVANTPSDQRGEAIAAFRSDSNQPMVIFNYGVLTAGFDAPKTRCVIVARPTTSLVLYSQMIGRAMRGRRSGGNRTCQIYTVVDTSLPGFGSMAAAFENWEELWQTN